MGKFNDSLLTVKEGRESTCDICERAVTKYAERNKRYDGLFVCLECDTIINKFLQLSGCCVVRVGKRIF